MLYFFFFQLEHYHKTSFFLFMISHENIDGDDSFIEILVVVYDRLVHNFLNCYILILGT